MHIAGFYATIYPINDWRKMQETEFRNWLEKTYGPDSNTPSTRLSNARWICTNVEDLDKSFDEDECESLLKGLEYNPNLTHPLEGIISGNPQTNLSMYRSVVRLYVEFKKGLTHDKREIHRGWTQPKRKPNNSLKNAMANIEESAGNDDNLYDLWKQFSVLHTKLCRIIGRSSNILGEISERVVARFHGGELLTASSASADVLLFDGKRIQVKSRTPRQTLTTSLGIIRSWDFDILAVLLFSELGDIVFGGEIDVESAKRHAVKNKHQNGWVITTTGDFLNDPNMKDLSRQYNEVLSNL